MDVATMVAINNLNMINMMTMLQEANNIVIMNENGKEWKDMDGSLLEQYMGRECVVSLFNEVGAIKGKLMAADAQWVQVDTVKKEIQLINRNMIRNITFDNK